jgi:putative transposase
MPHGAPHLPHRNYADPGHYFITAATEGRRPLFGQLTEVNVVSSPLGDLVHEAWRYTLERRPWVHSVVMVLMPDHIHGLVGWDTPPPAADGTLGRFVSQFKGVATRYARQRRLIPSWERLWQDGFWEIAIRDEEHFARVKRYIEFNPAREWRRNLSE